MDSTGCIDLFIHPHGYVNNSSYRRRGCGLERDQQERGRYARGSRKEREVGKGAFICSLLLKDAQTDLAPSVPSKSPE